MKSDRSRYFFSVFCSLFLLCVVTIAQTQQSQSNTQDNLSQNKTSEFKAWKITSGRSGGLAGMSQGYSLDSDGNLNQWFGAKKTTRKIEPEMLEKIRQLIQELDLPEAKTEIVKGTREYDGFYSGFTITLDDKNYKLAGRSFDDAEYIKLTATQQETFKKLNVLLTEITMPPNKSPSDR
jgi:hypothetical protein